MTIHHLNAVHEFIALFLLFWRLLICSITLQPFTGNPVDNFIVVAVVIYIVYHHTVIIIMIDC